MTWKKAALTALVAGVAAGCSSGGGGAPAAVIDLSGGGGSDTWMGGPAGGITIVTPSPGGVAIRRSGAADAAFAVPAWASTPVDLGTHGVTVGTTTAVVRLAAGANDPGAGVLYVVAGNTSVFEADGLGTVPVAAEAVTGLEVSAGAVLRLTPNFDANGDTTLEQVRLAFAGDVAVAGTLGLPLLERPAVQDRASLDLTASQVFVRASGKIDSRGGDALASDAPGGAGGGQAFHVRSLFVNEGTLDLGGGAGAGTGTGGAAGGATGLVVDTTGEAPAMAGGAILNAGSILLAAGDGSSGGDVGVVHLHAPSHVVNTGRIVHQGGAGSAGRGGAGGIIDLRSMGASIVNAGTLAARGGNGLGGGGPGGAVLMASGQNAAGDVINSGSITVDGGDDLDGPAGATSTDAAGGSAGGVEVFARGSFRSSGAVSADGGVGHGVSGGSGGHLIVALYSGEQLPGGGPTRLGAVQLSGALSARGGACPRGAGGMGGFLQLAHQPQAEPSEGDPGIDLLGYGGIVFDAGDGTTLGGSISSSFLIVLQSTSRLVPSGSIVNEVDVTARGGSGTGAAGSAGTAGYTPSPALYWFVEPGGNGTGGDIVNSGNIELSGGTSTGDRRGGDGTGLRWSAPGSIENSGRILCRGGDAQLGRGGAGAASGVLISAGVDLVNRGAIDATAGAGASGGPAKLAPPPAPPPAPPSIAAQSGPVSSVRLVAGHQVRNAGPIAIPGGRATDAVAGVAGSGGLIDLFSERAATENTATCNVAPGTGGHTAGQNGTIWIDGVDRTPAGGIL